MFYSFHAHKCIISDFPLTFTPNHPNLNGCKQAVFSNRKETISKFDVIKFHDSSSGSKKKKEKKRIDLRQTFLLNQKHKKLKQDFIFKFLCNN